MKPKHLYITPEKLCRKAASFLCPHLFSPQTMERLLHFTSLLPKDLTSKYFMFECPLDEEDKTDFLFELDLSPKNIPQLRNHFLPNALSNALQSTAWNKFALFMQDSLQTTLDQVKYEGIWMEFDIGSSSTYPPEPNFFLDGAGYQNKDVDALSLHAPTLFESAALAQQVKKYVAFCRTCDITLFSLGFMMGRNLHTLRVVVQGKALLREEVILQYLTLGNYSGNKEEIVQMISKIKPYIHSLNIHLDINKEQIDKVGIDLLFSPFFSVVKREEAFAPFFDILAAEGIVNPSKKAQFSAWFGDHLSTEIIETASENSFVSDSDPSNNAALYFKSITHIKLVYTSSQKRPKAKIYFDLRPLQLDLSYNALFQELGI